MPESDPQETWDDYYARIRERRLAEAELLWAQMADSGVSENTVMALDFVHFAKAPEDASALAQELGESYAVEVVPAADGYLLIKGTTRPEGICLSQGQHADWVAFMADVARSRACVFSTWTLEAPSLGKTFRSESVEPPAD